ncbi:hypothetical protein C6502_10660 [Candidatus Poribacteria bacterium]|nr:MAG: hypothetical protein C6502_10660 [Candidatus Poribacteria bacterium]
MLYRRTIDKQILNINDIKYITMFQSPLFSGYGESKRNKLPRAGVKMEDDSVGIRQVYPPNDSELLENEQWQRINWQFKDEEDHLKHLSEDEGKKIYYIIGALFLYDKNDTLVKPDIYVLKKLRAKNHEKEFIKYFEWDQRWRNLDWILQNWQIPISAIMGGIIGSIVAVSGNIVIEIIKRVFPPSP